MADAKTWFRVDIDDEDDLVTSLIGAARATVETAARRVLIQQTWRLALDAWPAARIDGARPFAPAGAPVKIPFAQVLAIDTIRVFDAFGVATVVAASSYSLVGAPNAARLLFTSAPPTPGRPADGIEIDVVAGYGAAPSDVPQPLRQAILMLVANWFEHRGDDDAADRIHVPASVAALVAPYRRLCLA